VAAPSATCPARHQRHRHRAVLPRPHDQPARLHDGVPEDAPGVPTRETSTSANEDMAELWWCAVGRRQDRRLQLQRIHPLPRDVSQSSSPVDCAASPSLASLGHRLLTRHAAALRQRYGVIGARTLVGRDCTEPPPSAPRLPRRRRLLAPSAAGNPLARARDAGCGALRKELGAAQAPGRGPHLRLPAYDHPDRRAHRDAGAPGGPGALGQLQHLLTQGPRRRRRRHRTRGHAPTIRRAFPVYAWKGETIEEVLVVHRADAHVARPPTTRT